MTQTEHRCEQNPSYWSRPIYVEEGQWILNINDEYFVDLNFCPYCGMKLEEPNL